MDTKIDREFALFKTNNPNMDNPHARLITAILMSAIHDAISSQASAVHKRQAWIFLEEDEVLMPICLAVINIDREPLIRRLKYMRTNNINLKSMYTKRESI